MDGVVTLIKSAGQYQVVIGNHVPDVYKDVCAVAGISSSKAEDDSGKKMSFGEKAMDLITNVIKIVFIKKNSLPFVKNEESFFMI